MEQDEKQFVAGFNSGYLLAKFEPTIISNLLKNSHPLTTYIQGLTSGQQEYFIEREYEISNLRQKYKDREIERED